LCRVFLVILSFISLSACSTTSYIIDTSIGQWKLFNRAKPIEEVLASPYTSLSTKDAIQKVIKAKNFAVNELGLKATTNYTKFVQLDGAYVSWAVSASNPLKLEEKKWRFPIVGEVPYIGFFSQKKAERFAENLLGESSGLVRPDIWIRGVPAFSSLGWFSDPLYSSMIDGSERDIVDLVIHESLHATVWVGDNVDFNEKLANFVGLEGSILYLKKYRASEVRQAREEVLGEKIFAEFIQNSINIYKSEVETLADKDPTRAFAAKKLFYGELSKNYDAFFETRKFFSPPLAARKLKVKLDNWNNAALLAFANYYSDFSVFEALLKKCNGELARFVRWIAQEKNAAENGDDKSKERFLIAPEEHLRALVEMQECAV